MEITNYKAVNKGSLIGSFDIEIPRWGITLKGCALFQNGHKRWVSMPSRQFEKDGQMKSFEQVKLHDSIKERFIGAVLEKIEKIQSQPKAANEEQTIPF